MIRIIAPILLVEDMLPDAELTMDALRDARVNNPVVHVSDGDEALDWLHHRGQFEGRHPAEPSLVLLDMKMPRMDGLETLREIRSDARTRSLPVVMLTSSRDESDVVASWNLGVNAYIVKPVGTEEFREAVKAVGNFWALLNELPAR